jgi:hypothetical protein
MIQWWLVFTFMRLPETNNNTISNVLSTARVTLPACEPFILICTIRKVGVGILFSSLVLVR